MKAEFSEFTYGFSLVSELSRALGCRAVPIFPNLIQEGRDGGGFDVKMNVCAVPLYLQFKLSDHLKTTGARCLIPRFDGAILSQVWKEALWDKFVTGAPRPRTPSERQYNDRKLRSRR